MADHMGVPIQVEIGRYANSLRDNLASKTAVAAGTADRATGLVLIFLLWLIDFFLSRSRDDDQQPLHHHQQQHGWLNSARKFHIAFGLLKLLTITHFGSLYIICEVIYLISLIEVTGPESPHWVYWYLYIGFGTLGFELLLWTNLSLVMWVIINLSLAVFALASSGVLARGSNRFLQLIQPLDDTPFSEVQFDD